MFATQASTQHPFYLTTGGKGGAGRAAGSNETVFAGGARSYGTPAAPYILKWTPNACVLLEPCCRQRELAGMTPPACSLLQAHECCNDSETSAATL